MLLVGDAKSKRRKSYQKTQKLTTFLGSLLAIAFLVGLAFTLTRSSMISFFDVLPVYILMGIAIFMMVYEAFFDRK